MASSRNEPSGNRKGGGYVDLDASARRVSERIERELARRRGPRRRQARWGWVAAAVLLLLVSLCLWAHLRPAPYERLSEELRIHLPATDLTAGTRASAPDGGQLLLATTLKAYHEQDYATARTGWQRLARDSEGEEQRLYRFYEGTSVWLAGRPARAVERLEPLLPLADEDTLLYRRISYVLGLCYVETDRLREGAVLLRNVAGVPDDIGRRARRMLDLLPG